MTKHNVIAIMGMPYAGKNEVIQYILAVYRIPKFSFKTVLEEEIRNFKIPLGYIGSIEVRKRLEGTLGQEYFPRRIIELIEADPNEDALIDGLDLEGRIDFDVLKRHFGNKLHTIIIRLPITHIFQEFLHDARQIVKLDDGGPLVVSDHLITHDGNITKLMNAVDSIMWSYGIIKR